MTPEKQQQLINILDEMVSDRGNLELPSPLSEDPEAVREWKMLKLALESIQYDAISREVQGVRQQLESGKQARLLYLPSEENDTENNRGTNPSVVRKLFMPARRIAAILLLATGLAGIGKYLNTSPTTIFENNYNSYELGSTRGNDAVNELEKAYDQKDWASVVHDFELTRPKTAKDYFLTGMAYMEQKEYFEAIGLFKSLIRLNGESREPSFQDEAEYYLAMSYLASHQTAQALELFDKIKSDPHHIFYKQVNHMSSLDMFILRAK